MCQTCALTESFSPLPHPPSILPKTRRPRPARPGTSDSEPSQVATILPSRLVSPPLSRTPSTVSYWTSHVGLNPLWSSTAATGPRWVATRARPIFCSSSNFRRWAGPPFFSTSSVLQCKYATQYLLLVLEQQASNTAAIATQFCMEVMNSARILYWF